MHCAGQQHLFGVFRCDLCVTSNYWIILTGFTNQNIVYRRLGHSHEVMNENGCNEINRQISCNFRPNVHMYERIR